MGSDAGVVANHFWGNVSFILSHYHQPHPWRVDATHSFSTRYSAAVHTAFAEHAAAQKPHERWGGWPGDRWAVEICAICYPMLKRSQHLQLVYFDYRRASFSKEMSVSSWEAAPAISDESLSKDIESRSWSSKKQQPPFSIWVYIPTWENTINYSHFHPVGRQETDESEGAADAAVCCLQCFKCTSDCCLELCTCEAQQLDRSINIIFQLWQLHSP